ncbi:hypothetical protein GPECTOR_3g524 [Gonium pectorale]|uniref:Uncharacterized protein n=1 Tax=Gonium pectorale TaxID=33097 RepID=A0A150GZQ0_GONPE|nr:hypothetical protein GPECTOR_3g524 [Gonium pectorale]|eukprot:KXZ55397.1 hypothetical protein GPECTOR_3g524 [Gonium pectorale]
MAQAQPSSAQRGSYEQLSGRVNTVALMVDNIKGTVTNTNTLAVGTSNAVNDMSRKLEEALNRMNNMTGHKRKHQQTDTVKTVNNWPCDDHKHMTKGGAKKQNA